MNQIILGVLGRAQRRFGLTIFAFQFLSDHYHMLVWPDHAQQLAGFMEYFNGNLGREAGRLSDWSGKVWHRRYYSAVVKENETSQCERLRYILSNGCKEGLVASPREWPGASSTRALLDGSLEVSGTWFDRTREYRASANGRPDQFPAKETVRLSKLPCLAHLAMDRFCRSIEDIVAEIEAETAAMHRGNGTTPAGVEWVMKQDPHRVPKQMKRSPARRFLSAFQESIAELREAYADFVSRYREASQRLRNGDRTAAFPVGCFPPHLPFVRAGP